MGQRGVTQEGAGADTWDGYHPITNNSIEEPVHIDALVGVVACYVLYVMCYILYVICLCVSVECVRRGEVGWDGKKYGVWICKTVDLMKQ